MTLFARKHVRRTQELALKIIIAVFITTSGNDLHTIEFRCCTLVRHWEDSYCGVATHIFGTIDWKVSSEKMGDNCKGTV